MNTEEILTKIEIILPKLQQWITFKEASFLPEELSIVKEVASAILPGRFFNWGCPPCGGEALYIIYSFYQRERK